jgi:hypothetical protein
MKILMKYIFSIILISLVLMGCTRTYGSPAVKQAIITKNLPSAGITKDELISSFGKPYIINDRAWMFLYTESRDESVRNPYCTVCCPPSVKALILGGIILPLLFSDCFYDDMWEIKVTFDESSSVERCSGAHTKKCRSGFIFIEGHQNVIESETYP